MLTQIDRLVSTGALTCLGLGALLGSGRVNAVVVERRTVAMGTELVARVVAADQAGGDAAIRRAFAEAGRLDDLLSTWRADATLAGANAVPVGRAVALPGELAGLLEEAWMWAARTHGAFDPAIGALVDAWDLRGAGRLPDTTTLARAVRATGTDCFTLAGDTLVRHDSLAWIDSGGFGKGAALRAAAAALGDAGIDHAMLNFGGQVLALGHAPGREAWEISVAHPARRGSSVATVRLANRSAATTGQSERFIVAGGDTLGHVLDPRSGRPVAPWGSVTVVHRDPLVADILSTALFVLGPDAGLAWLEGRDDVAALFLIRRSRGLGARWNQPMDTLLSQWRW